MISEQQFQQLAGQGYNRIPLVKRMLADLDTPLSTYLKIADGPYSYLLESFQGGEKWGRYSIIGLPCREIIKVFEHEIRIEHDGQLIEAHQCADPLAWIQDFIDQNQVAEIPDLPTFNGGLVGYFGYDIVRYVEPRLSPCPLPDPLANPDILLMVSDDLVVFDNTSGDQYLIVHANPAQEKAYEQGCQRLEELTQRLRDKTIQQQQTNLNKNIQDSDFESNTTNEAYQQAVNKAKQYIVDGDAMQIVYSQRLNIPFDAPATHLYRALRSMNPSPYMYYLNLQDFHIVGASPEILVRVQEGEVTVRPIAGTRPRGETIEQDKQLEQELLSDPKELAEHLMLIDLGRNDVGKVSEIGSVNVTEKMIIERYSHVMHIVSNVTGELKAGLTAMDALKATFPAGTLSGAPKIRAMEIIDELETEKRGVYGGAVGYLAWNGNMDVAIAIRTAVIKNKQLYVQAGGGLVTDSVPINEWQESMNKAKAIFRAVALVEKLFN